MSGPRTNSAGGEKDDWSKHLADNWGLAWCREDVELQRRLAPYYPVKRLYNRLCHDPDVPFLPLRFGVVLFLYMVIWPLAGGVKSDFSLDEWLFYLILCYVLSALVGLVFDFFLLPLIMLFGLTIESLCAGIDILFFNPRIWWQKRNKR